jgi:CO/xanthine dehydrogenase FAD-binding subunit
MAERRNQVFYPSGFTELFNTWNRFPDSVPAAGATGLIRFQADQLLDLPRSIIYLDHLDELRKITRTERYLEIGAMVRLSELEGMGKIVPEALEKTIAHIANPQLRNIATMGGNICYPHRRLDISAPMIALDAHYELRKAKGVRWVSASRFALNPGPPAIDKQELLTRIRIPLDRWDYSVFRKIENSGAYGNNTVMIFIIKTQKNVLTDVRLVFSAASILRDRNSESFLTGKQLPLSHRNALEFIEHWRIFLAAVNKPEYSAGDRSASEVSQHDAPETSQHGMSETSFGTPLYGTPQELFTKDRILNLIKKNILLLAD